MIKRLVLICVALLFFTPLFADDVMHEPGMVGLSVSGSTLTLVSFEPDYALLPQLMVQGTLGFHFGDCFGGSVYALIGHALPSLAAQSLYRYKGFDYYGAGVGGFIRTFPSNTWIVEYILKAFANLSWHPETLMMYFFISVIPEFTITPMVLAWQNFFIQGSIELPFHIHENFFSFGLGFSVRLLTATASGKRLL